MLATLFFAAVVIIAFATGEWMGVIFLGLAELCNLCAAGDKSPMEMTEIQYKYGRIFDFLTLVMTIGAIAASIWACF